MESIRVNFEVRGTRVGAGSFCPLSREDYCIAPRGPGFRAPRCLLVTCWPVVLFHVRLHNGGNAPSFVGPLQKEA